MNLNKEFSQQYSAEAVATMARCLVDIDTFLAVRPQISIKTATSMNRRLRTRGFPGAFRLPGDRQWSIDLVTYDREVTKMLESSLVQMATEAEKELPPAMAGLVSIDSLTQKVLRKLAAAR